MKLLLYTLIVWSLCTECYCSVSTAVDIVFAMCHSGQVSLLQGPKQTRSSLLQRNCIVVHSMYKVAQNKVSHFVFFTSVKRLDWFLSFLAHIKSVLFQTHLSTLFSSVLQNCKMFYIGRMCPPSCSPRTPVFWDQLSYPRSKVTPFRGLQLRLRVGKMAESIYFEE